MIRTCMISAAFLVAGLSSAQAQLAVEEIRLQAFGERSGAFTENLVGTRKKLVNSPKGEGELGEPAEQVLVTMVFSGPKNTRSSDKVARDLASVTVTQSAKTGQRTLLRRAYGGFVFGDNGRYHKAFMLDNATCAPLEVDVRLGRSRRTVKVDFNCSD